MTNKLSTHQLINQDSGDTEYYTPEAILVAARDVMGGIDLDPASSAQANQTVQAAQFFTQQDKALEVAWYGRVWMNHPFSKGWTACTATCKRKTCVDRNYHIPDDIPSNREWIQKLVLEYTHGHIQQACNITFAATSEAWFQPLLRYPQCFLYPRTNYMAADGMLKRGVTKGSVVTYFGPHVDKFAIRFSTLGVVKVAYAGRGVT